MKWQRPTTASRWRQPTGTSPFGSPVNSWQPSLSGCGQDRAIRRPFVTLIGVALAGLLLTACTPTLHLNGRNKEGFKKSLAVMAAATPIKDRKAFNKDGTYFEGLYFGSKSAKGAPNWHAVNRMTRPQFMHFVAMLEHKEGPSATKGKVTPDWYLTSEYLNSLKVEKRILLAKRTRAHKQGHYTIDQFSWAQPYFTPPRATDNLLDSKAGFAMEFTNHTKMDVYPPTLHLTITEPGLVMPVFDQDLKLVLPTRKHKNPYKASTTRDEGKPIPPGTPTLIRYTCCDLVTAPGANQLMQSLPAGAEFHYTITSIDDYTHRDQLDHHVFTSKQNHDLLDAEHCIKDVKSHLKTWTPNKAVMECDHEE